MNLTNAEIIGLVTLAFGAMAGAMGLVFRMLITALREDRDNWRQMAKEGNDALEKAAWRYVGGVPKLAPVEAEHSSPPTVGALGAAELQTERARLVASKLAFGFESRSESEAKTEAITTAIGAAANLSQTAADKIGELEEKSKEDK